MMLTLPSVDTNDVVKDATPVPTKNRTMAREGKKGILSRFLGRSRKRNRTCSFSSSTVATEDMTVGSSYTSSPVLSSELSISERTTTTTTTTTARSVSFAPLAQARRTISIKDYTQEEIRNCWYSEEEYNHIRSSCIRIVHMSSAGEKVFQSKRQTLRGLECQLPASYASKMATRQSAMGSVFVMQNESFLNDDGGEETISQVYSTISSSSRLWAHCVGLKDQREAEACYDEDDYDFCASVVQR